MYFFFLPNIQKSISIFHCRRHAQTHGVQTTKYVFHEKNDFIFAQCGNFMIFLSLRFYVKSILGILEVQNLSFDTFRGCRFWFYWILTFWSLKFTKLTKSSALKMEKLAVLQLQNSPKLIWRKIGVTEKSWKLCTLYCDGKNGFSQKVGTYQHFDWRLWRPAPGFRTAFYG